MSDAEDDEFDFYQKEITTSTKKWQKVNFEGKRKIFTHLSPFGDGPKPSKMNYPIYERERLISLLQGYDQKYVEIWQFESDNREFCFFDLEEQYETRYETHEEYLERLEEKFLREEPDRKYLVEYVKMQDTYHKIRYILEYYGKLD